LVGFKGHYIYYVYIPLKRRVVRTSHYCFDEGQGLIIESNSTDLSLLDCPNIRGDGQGNQDFKDTSISPSQETISFDTHDWVSYDEIDPNSLFNLQGKPQDEPQGQLTNDNDDDLIELAPEVTVKRGQPKGSRNRVYSPIAKEDKYTTRSS
jgi:hypothetical protein